MLEKQMINQQLAQQVRHWVEGWRREKGLWVGVTMSGHGHGGWGSEIHPAASRLATHDLLHRLRFQARVPLNSSFAEFENFHSTG